MDHPEEKMIFLRMESQNRKGNTKAISSTGLTDDELDRLRAAYPDVDTLGSFKDFDLFYHGQTVRNPWAAILSHLKKNPRKTTGPVVGQHGNKVAQPQRPKVWNRADNPEYHKRADAELAAMVDENNQRRQR